jgi:hypothetical protein
MGNAYFCVCVDDFVPYCTKIFRFVCLHNGVACTGDTASMPNDYDWSFGMDVEEDGSVLF